MKAAAKSNQIFLLLLALWLLGRAEARAQVVLGGAADPGNYSVGMTRSHWAPSLGCVLIAYGNGSSSTGNNSLRCYRPIQDTWVTLYPDTKSATGPTNRDNQVQWYVENTKELWVWGGTAGLQSGRFNLSACAPVPTTNCATLAFSDPRHTIDTVENFTGGGSDSGHEWNPACDGGAGCGLIVGGNGGAVDSKVWIIERNTGAGKYCGQGAGIKPWIACEFLATKPPARNQALGSVVAAHGDFYVAAGTAPDNITQRSDLWKFTRATNSFSQVHKTAPHAGYQSSVTFDSDLNMIVISGANTSNKLQFLIGWDVANALWVDMSSIVASLACRGNQAGAYSPVVKRHIYEGGNYCTTGNAVGANLTQVSPSGFSAGGRLYLAPGLWVTKPMPRSRADAQKQVIGETGYGPGVSAGGSKHQRIRYSPSNGRLYFLHGDYDGAPFIGSFRSDIFSYDMLASSTVSEAARWRLEWPYCGLSGEISPAYVDEAAVAIDTTRNKVLYPGGFSGGGQPAIVGVCGNHGIKGNYYGNTAPNPGTYMEFDLATNRFSLRQGFTLHPYGNTRQGVYNPTTNELIVPHRDGGGSGMSHMNVSTGAWTRYGMVCATRGPKVAADATGSCAPSGTNYINSANLINEQLALDIENQVIYVIDTTSGTGGNTNPDPNLRFRLLKYNIKNHATTNYGYISLPVGADTVQTPGVGQPHFCFSAGTRACFEFPYYAAPEDSTMLAWDSVNNRLLWPASNNAGRPILMIWNPTTATWSIDPMIRDRPNVTLFGSNGTYIPEINALVMFGGFGYPGYGSDDYLAKHCPKTCSAPITHFSLYRFGGATPSGNTPSR